MSALSHVSATAVFALLCALAIDASAAGVRVTCEVRANRSKISVDGRGLAAGVYTTQALSGRNLVTSPGISAIGGEVEADFDSNTSDIAEGATPIAPNFIVGGRVIGKVIDSTGSTVASDTVLCRIKKR